MFSGIIEAIQPVSEVSPKQASVQISVEIPAGFDDLEIGHSVAVNGICLTIEDLNYKTMTFTMGHETLKVLGVDPLQANQLKGRQLNLERSLKFGDRMHGHLVTGHVDCLGELIGKQELGDNLLLKISFASEKSAQNLSRMIWRKGSVAVNGVSLTVNDLGKDHFDVCLIPETQKRTNLSLLSLGDRVTLEFDQLARALERRHEVQL